jgi:iron(III) transport system substrate-binding protein
VRSDAEPLPGLKPISEIKTITVSAAEIARDLPDAIERWRDTFGN